MKKAMFGFLLMIGACCPMRMYAAPLVTEAPVNGYGTPVTIAISTVTLTKVPTNQTSGRVGIYINNPSTTAVAGFLGDCTSTSIATTVRPIQLSLTTVGTGPSDLFYISMREDVCLWLISLLTSGAASQNVHVQELKQ